MFKTLRDAWSIAEIRKKLLYTLLMLLIFRLGSAVVVPFLDTSTVSTWMASNATGGNFLEDLDIITGGALSQATVFSLSITPYINASIIMQLLTYALPPLERMRDEGEEGQKKLNKITAAVSLALSVFMSFAYYLTLKNQMNVLSGVYHQERTAISSGLQQFLKIKNVTTNCGNTISTALRLYMENRLDFVDCLLCAYHMEYQHEICTFDKKLNRLIHHTSIT